MSDIHFRRGRNFYMAVFPQKTPICCWRCKSKMWYSIQCSSCLGFTCLLHATFWTDKQYHCRHCFRVLPFQGNNIPLKIIKNTGLYDPVVLLVLDGLYVAGAQRHCLELLQVFRNSGLNTVVLAIEGGGQWADNFINATDCLIVSYDGLVTFEQVQKACGYPHIRFVTAHLCHPIDWAVKHIPNSIAIVAHFHSEPSSHEPITGQQLSTYIYRCHRILVPCEKTQQTYKRLLEYQEVSLSSVDKVQILFNGFYKSPLNIQCRSSQLDVNYDHLDSQIKIAVISRLDEDKFAVKLFVETLNCLYLLSVDFCVCVAGVGELQDDLKKELSQVKFSEKVNLLGFVDNVNPLYKWAHVIFLPSLRESMPYVYLEAKAFNRPLVAPCIGLFASSHASGAFIYDYQSPAKAAEQIIRASKSCPAKADDICESIWATQVKKAYEL